MGQHLVDTRMCKRLCCIRARSRRPAVVAGGGFVVHARSVAQLQLARLCGRAPRARTQKKPTSLFADRRLRRMPRGGARRDRLGGRVVASTLGYRDAILLAGQGHSVRQIMDRLGYKTPSAPVHAITRGIEISEIRPGLARVVLDRVRVIDRRFDERVPGLVGDELDAADMLGFELHVLGLRLEDTLRDVENIHGARDVARLISWRTPGLPPDAGPAREERLQLRMMEATLDQIRGDYCDRSGVHRAIDRDLRRELLAVIARVHVDDMGRLRSSLHQIEVGFRRKHPVWDEMVEELAKVVAVLEAIGVIWIGRIPTTAKPARVRGGVLRPWVVDSRTRAAG